MKQCPFCNEILRDELNKCPKCARVIEERRKEKWYFKNSTLVIALLSIGPFALPFLWLNPRFNKATKWVISTIVAILTYYLVVAFSNSLKSLSVYYQQLNSPNF